MKAVIDIIGLVGGPSNRLAHGASAGGHEEERFKATIRRHAAQLDFGVRPRRFCPISAQVPGTGGNSWLSCGITRRRKPAFCFR